MVGNGATGSCGGHPVVTRPAKSAPRRRRARRPKGRPEGGDQIGRHAAQSPNGALGGSFPEADFLGHWWLEGDFATATFAVGVCMA